MATYGWRSPVAVAEGLSHEAPLFEFRAAVRLLEAMAPERAPVGRGAAPDAEVVRFAVPPELGFPASDVAALEPAPPGAPARLWVNVLGLIGVSGPLPHFVTETVRERVAAGDGAFAAFLDLFHHRLISLFYRACQKHAPALTAASPAEGPLARVLLALAGLGTPRLGGRLGVPDRALCQHAGLLAGTPRTMAGLERFLAHHFGVGVEIRPFAGRFLDLEPEDTTRIGRRGANHALGVSAVLGSRSFEQAAGFEVRLGPLSSRELAGFLPVGAAFPALFALTRFYVGEELGFRFRLVVAAEAVAPTQLGQAGDVRLGQSALLGRGAAPRLGGAGGSRLGWNSWLVTRKPPAADAQVVLEGRP